MALFWIILAVVFLIIEAITLGLSTIWCAIGCFVAAILASFNAPNWVQMLAMIIVSISLFTVYIIWIKPHFGKLRGEKDPTNADRVIDKVGTVIKDINVLDAVGQVKVNGQIWSATADKDIPMGKKVKVLEIRGVKLVVVEVD